jgi:hypothetical protein
VRIASADHATADVTVFRGDDSPEWEALQRIPTNTWVDFHCADLAHEFRIEGELAPNVVIPRTSIERCGALEIVPRWTQDLEVRLELAKDVGHALLFEERGHRRYTDEMDAIPDDAPIPARYEALRVSGGIVESLEDGRRVFVFEHCFDGSYVLELLDTGDFVSAGTVRIVTFDVPHEGPVVVR